MSGMSNLESASDIILWRMCQKMLQNYVWYEQSGKCSQFSSTWVTIYVAKFPQLHINELQSAPNFVAHRSTYVAKSSRTYRNCANKDHSFYLRTIFPAFHYDAFLQKFL